MPHENYYLGKEIVRDRQRAAEQERRNSMAQEKRRSIPQSTALALCQQIQQESRMPLTRWRCWRCVKQGQDGLPARLVAIRTGRCNCPLVIRRYLKGAPSSM